MKKIIHLKLPIDENHNIVYTQETVRKAMDKIQNKVGDDYIVISTVFDIELLDKDEKIINIDCNEYSYNELQEIIEKAWKYDKLDK